MAKSKKYHLRRMDKALPKRADHLAVIRGQKFLTLAMADNNRPYLVTLNYGFAPREKCFYIHCATEGKKLAILRRNPRIWGQVVEDRGYIPASCSHAYRSVMFEGRAEWVKDLVQKRRALELMVDQLDPNPEAVKRKLTDKVLKAVTILRLRVATLSGKISPPPKK